MLYFLLLLTLSLTYFEFFHSIKMSIGSSIRFDEEDEDGEEKWDQSNPSTTSLSIVGREFSVKQE